MVIRKVLFLTLVLLVTGGLYTLPVSATPTTELHIVKYANDGSTILNETTVNFTWMEANLPVYGDGTTHYYHQGLNSTDGWNVKEDDPAILTKDMGAVKGTNLKDLCDLVGGMSPADRNVTLLSNDGFSKRFAYSSIYAPPARAGPIVITWFMNGNYVNGTYADGMRNVMFADTSVNPWGYHVFGVYDMNQTYPSEFWYFYGGNPETPTTTGLSAKYIDRVYIYSNEPAPSVHTIYDGEVDLTYGETFNVIAYNNVSNSYSVNRTTPLGALDAVAASEGFTYNASDKRWSYDQVLLLDDIGQYLRKYPNYWYAYVNGAYKDGFGNHANGLNVIELVNGDQVNFYYAPNNDPNPVINATDVIKIRANISATGPSVHTIYDGEAYLAPGETFNVIAYNNVSNSYTVNRTTPLGALDAVAASEGFTYNASDKRWSYDQVLLLDDIGQYLRKYPNYWYAYVNGAYKDGFGNHANGLNVIELVNGDQVNFYYAPNNDPNPVINATDVIKIRANTTARPPVTDWTLTMSGARDTTVSKTLFEQGLACPSSGHQVFWNDTDNNRWGGVPLWLLVGMVDDNPDIGPLHSNFNDSIAAQGYSVKVISGDGWDTTLSSADIARNDSYIVANTLNGQPLAVNTTSGKLSWPLHLKGEAVFGGQQVGNITRIELTGLPEPATGWTLTLEGDVTDTITQSYFEEAIACHHNITWNDGNGREWQGVALWDLVGVVDDIETSSHFTFNDTRAATNYTIRVSAADGFNAPIHSVPAAHNDGYIVAYRLNGIPLTGTDAPLKLVGPSTTSGKERVGNISSIALEGLPDQFPAGDWQLNLNGTISDVIPQAEFEYWASQHSATYTDANSNVYTGIPLWRLMGWVDDRVPHGSNGFNDAAATAGYTVIVKAGDGYAKEFTSQEIGKTDAFIVANTLNGSALSTTGSHPPYPLRLVGSGISVAGNSVGNIVEIELADFQTPSEIPGLHIVKYDSDGVTVINETTVDYTWMESSLPVIGDGTTVYKFEGLTMNASNLWDPEETYPGGFKVSNAVKGSRVLDLVELVGGMGSGTAVTFVASDGFETTLPYSSIYTNPAVQARQGDAIIAWYADGSYVPAYGDGMRLFFTPGGDHVYGAWDMHETLPEVYWRYNYQNGVNYPSAAGLSAKYITTIRVHSVPESDWTLSLDGQYIGGIRYTVSKQFFEEALGCTMGADHKATYTDSKGRVWEGMPLWFLAGYVDDADQHSSTSFNETLASAGYSLLISSTDGTSTVVDSRQMMHTSNYILANSLNGTHIQESDTNWPLRLTGANVSGSSAIRNVSSIRLLRTVAPAMIGVYMDGSWYLDRNGDGLWDAGDQNYGFGAPLWTPVTGDWNKDGNTEIGVYRDGAWYLDSDATGWWSAGDQNYGYGAPGWTPVVGDWNGNGSDKIGVYKDGAWYLDSDGSGTWNAGDKNYAFGGADWRPVVGKWNDGVTKIGVYRDGIYYIDYTGDGVYGAGDKTFMYGSPGSTAVTGDWNANGLTEVGTQTGSTWQLDYDGLGAVNASTKSYAFGSPGWKPVTGDWNADGTDKIGIFLDGAWYLDQNGNGVWDAGTDKNFAFGTAGWIPVIGKWG